MLKPEFCDPHYRFHRVLSQLKKNKIAVDNDASWLDLGCGQGDFLNLIVGKYGVKATGIDNFDPKFKGQELWAYLQRDLADFNINEKFKFVSALEVLEHMIDTDRFLKDCFECLQNSGYLIITTPNINSLRNRVMTFFGAYPVGLEYKNTIHHVRLYNVKHLKDHLAEHGYRILSVSGVSFLPIRMNHEIRAVRLLSEYLADRLPQLCNNLIVIAAKTG